MKDLNYSRYKLIVQARPPVTSPSHFSFKPSCIGIRFLNFLCTAGDCGAEARAGGEAGVQVFVGHIHRQVRAALWEAHLALRAMHVAC